MLALPQETAPPYDLRITPPFTQASLLKIKPALHESAYLIVLVGFGLEVLPHPGGRVVAHHSNAFELLAAGFSGLFCQVGCGLTITTRARGSV